VFSDVAHIADLLDQALLPYQFWYQHFSCHMLHVMSSLVRSGGVGSTPGGIRAPVRGPAVLDIDDLTTG
jgi:hypothetical protein